MKNLVVFALLAVLVSCSKAPTPPQPEFIMKTMGKGAPNITCTFQIQAFPPEWSQVSIWAELRDKQNGTVLQRWNADQMYAINDVSLFTVVLDFTKPNIVLHANSGSRELFLADPQPWRSTLSSEFSEHIPAKTGTDIRLIKILEHSDGTSPGQELVVEARVRVQGQNN